MIALTQEKRQKRINWLKDRISSMEQCRDEMPFGLSEDESMELSAYKVSLASLTAETIGWGLRRTDGDRGYGNWLTSSPRKQDYLDYQPHAYENVPLFTAPPVPEIKLPEKLNAGEIHYELTEKYGLDVSIDQLERGLAEEVYSIAVNTFERLNGLGE